MHEFFNTVEGIQDNIPRPVIPEKDLGAGIEYSEFYNVHERNVC